MIMYRMLEQYYIELNAGAVPFRFKSTFYSNIEVRKP